MSLADLKARTDAAVLALDAGNYDLARREIAAARIVAAGTPEGSFDGATYKLRIDALNQVEKTLDDLKRTSPTTSDRAIHTRTTFPTRCPGW